MFLALEQAGSEYGVGVYGAYAANSMRLEKGYRAWGSDLTTERSPIEAGLAQFVKPDGRSFVEHLLELEPDVHVHDDMGRTALMYAVWAAEVEIAQKLVRMGSDLNAVEWEDGNSVLGWAELSARPDEMTAWVKKALAAQAASGSEL